MWFTVQSKDTAWKKRRPVESSLQSGRYIKPVFLIKSPQLVWENPSVMGEFEEEWRGGKMKTSQNGSLARLRSP